MIPKEIQGVNKGKSRGIWEVLMKQYKLFVTRELYNSTIGKKVVREMNTIVRHSVLGDCSEVKEGAILKRVMLGAESSINGNCSVEYADIGKRVQIAYGCNIVGVTHEHSKLAIDHTDLFYEISIGDSSFIGMGCNILPGVKIGQFCIVAAGSVLNKDVPDGYVYMGTPQNFILKKRECLEKLIEEYSDPEFLAGMNELEIDAYIIEQFK